MPGIYANDNGRSEALTETLETEAHDDTGSMSATGLEGEEPDLRAAGHDEGSTIEEPRGDATDSDTEDELEPMAEPEPADAGEDMRRSA